MKGRRETGIWTEYWKSRALSSHHQPTVRVRANRKPYHFSDSFSLPSLFANRKCRVTTFSCLGTRTTLAAFAAKPLDRQRLVDLSRRHSTADRPQPLPLQERRVVGSRTDSAPGTRCFRPDPVSPSTVNSKGHRLQTSYVGERASEASVPISCKRPISIEATRGQGSGKPPVPTSVHHLCLSHSNTSNLGAGR